MSSSKIPLIVIKNSTRGTYQQIKTIERVKKISIRSMKTKTMKANFSKALHSKMFSRVPNQIEMILLTVVHRMTRIQTVLSVNRLVLNRNRILNKLSKAVIRC